VIEQFYSALSLSKKDEVMKYLQNILSGLSIRSTCGDGALLNGTRSVFFGGILPVSSVRKVPFTNDRRAATQGSDVL
jgi:hypothetical protein